MLWGLKPVEQQAAYGLAVQRLKRQVHLGLLLPGERMPAERKLAEQIGISRVTLREALRVLETEGYVSIRRGATGGAFVAEEGRLRQMALKHLSSDPTDVMRIFEYRYAVEPMAAELATLRRTPGDLRRIDEAAGEIERAETVGLLRRGEAAFHLAVAGASANRFIATSIEEALASLFLPLADGDLSVLRARSLLIRGQVAEAIYARREAVAAQRMRVVIEDEQGRLPSYKAA
ncbi:MAG: GntR family transcriptional regulator [Pseudomonadota bacterium]